MFDDINSVSSEHHRWMNGYCDKSSFLSALLFCLDWPSVISLVNAVKVCLQFYNHQTLI